MDLRTKFSRFRVFQEFWLNHKLAPPGSSCSLRSILDSLRWSRVVMYEVILIKVVGIRLVGSRVCGRDSDAGGLQIGGI